jgi:A/G-specific adenine glycosylase
MNFLAKKLLAWYDRSKRDLPWRRTNDAYQLWVSETMLQQTQVETVIPYYERFLKRWPTVQALAAAPLDDVLKMWEGLGYYARARNLRKGAQYVVRELGGQLPHDVVSLRKIPGIGRYTAGALASVAFNQDEPTVDGNIRRVLCRLFAVRDDPRKAAVQERLWQHARDILPHGRAGDFNQALMELGASLCSPRKPQCWLCPVRDECQALALGIQDQLPIKVAKKATPHYTWGVGVIWKRGRVLIAQRQADGLLGGLWEFVNGKVERGEALPMACKRIVKKTLGVTVKVREPLTIVTHAFSHFKVTLHVFSCDYVRGIPQVKGVARVRWTWLSELEKFAWSAAQRKIVMQLKAKRD